MNICDAFLAEIRGRPEFISAATSDPTWAEHLDAMERGLEALYRDPEEIESLDKIQAVIRRSDLSLKQRLLELGKLLTQARDAGRIIH